MRSARQPAAETCFHERDPGIPIARRATAEGVGTLLLVFAAAAAGLAAQHLTPHGPAFALVASAVATAGALVGLIVAFGPVSGGHFNPLITGLQWLAGERGLDCAAAYVAAQMAGGIGGALLTNALFTATDGPVTLPTANWTLAASEAVAAAGLMVVVFGCARGGRAETGPFAVGAWLVAAILVTPSTSYANPAVALGASFAVGPMALPPTTAAVYAMAEIAGALVALLVVTIVYPSHRGATRPAEPAVATVSRGSAP